jgi:hypothetical protein
MDAVYIGAGYIAVYKPDRDIVLVPDRRFVPFDLLSFSG